MLAVVPGQQATRFQYIDSLFDARMTAAIVPAGATLAELKLDNAPHGVYQLIVGFNQFGGVAATDGGNAEVRKNGQRKYPLAIVAAMQPGFVAVLNPGDVISVNAIAAGSAAAVYGASLQLVLVHEMSANPSEHPDVMAVLASQQQRIGEALERMTAQLERLIAK